MSSVEAVIARAILYIHVNTGNPGRLIVRLESRSGVESGNQSAWAACVYVHAENSSGDSFHCCLLMINVNGS